MQDDLVIAPETPESPDVLALLAAGDAFSAALYPAKSRHSLELGDILRPEVTLLVARAGRRAAGCGAVVRRSGGYGEVKRMYVAEEARGQGIGRRLLAELEQVAQGQGLSWLGLETGIHQPAAIALYRGAGFREVEPFGQYVHDPLSLFMRKDLQAGTVADGR
jgi:putative acetyltransferase